MYQELKEILRKIFNFIFDELRDYYEANKKFFEEVIEKNDKEPIYCKEFKLVSKIVIYILILFFILSLVWVIYEIFRIIYLYIYKTIYYVNLTNKRLLDNPLFIQVKKLTYFNDYFSIDLLFLIFATTPIFILIMPLMVISLNLEITSFRTPAIWVYIFIMPRTIAPRIPR